MQPRPSIWPCMQFLFVQSGFPLELPFPRFVASPRLFFRSVFPHHHGTLWTFTTVRVSRRSYKVKAAQVLPVRPLLALAAIYSRGTCRPTTIDVLMFHFRVRNGTGWGHQAVTTRLRRFSFAAPCARVSSQGWFVESSVQFPGRGGLASARRWDLRFTMYYVLF